MHFAYKLVRTVLKTKKAGPIQKISSVASLKQVVGRLGHSGLELDVDGVLSLTSKGIGKVSPGSVISSAVFVGAGGETGSSGPCSRSLAAMGC